MFDESKWMETCKSLSKEANIGSGLSFELYIARFNQLIDLNLHHLPKAHRPLATSIAEKNWGYNGSHKSAQPIQLDENEGDCSHGIALGCCPAGCE